MDSLDILTWQIVKWVLIVLVAAFIGQFGKTFAQCFMHRFRRGKTDAQPSVSVTTESPVPADVALTTSEGASRASLKAQKKEAKVLLKMKKKDEKNK